MCCSKRSTSAVTSPLDSPFILLSAIKPADLAGICCFHRPCRLLVIDQINCQSVSQHSWLPSIVPYSRFTTRGKCKIEKPISTHIFMCIYHIFYFNLWFPFIHTSYFKNQNQNMKMVKQFVSWFFVLSFHKKNPAHCFTYYQEQEDKNLQLVVFSFQNENPVTSETIMNHEWVKFNFKHENL